MSRYYTGLTESSQAYLVSRLNQDYQRILLIANSPTRVGELVQDINFFAGAEVALPFLPWDVLPFEPVNPSLDVSASRLSSLYHVGDRSSSVLVTSPESLLQRVWSVELVTELSFKLRPGLQYPRDALVKALVRAGFEQVGRVEQMGQAAIRGEVIDIFPVQYDSPVRIEFFDDEVEALKLFSVDDQRTFSTIDSVLITPLREYSNLGAWRREDKTSQAISRLRSRGKELNVLPRWIEEWAFALEQGVLAPGIELFDPYFDSRSVFLTDELKFDAVCLEDWAHIQETQSEYVVLCRERFERLAERRHLVPDLDQVFQDSFELSCQGDLVHLSSLVNAEQSQPISLNTLANIELTNRSRSSGEALSNFILELISEGWQVGLVVGSEGRAKQLAERLIEGGLAAEYLQTSFRNWQERKRPAVAILLGQRSEGFRLEAEKLALVSEEEIFLKRSVRRKARGPSLSRRRISTLNNLSEGDYLVHLDYGIGQYQGLVSRVLDGVAGEFLEIQYADSKLLLPIQMIGKIHRFSATEGQIPRLDKLSSTRWATTKRKVKESVAEMAGDLIKLYATRSIVRGWRYDPGTAQDEWFAEQFPYNETADQMKAIEETLGDLVSDKPMDRLVCGDVGFGKTEVAMRAAFKCVQHSRQVAVLVPTTVLAEQHYRNFQDRFSSTPFEVGVLSRFHSASRNRETVERVKKGEIDILIGTHRILGKQVRFSDLGMVIIDEEHRFGVKQKERFKELKNSIDVLALTATPIPRTMQMALTGIRDISVIETPPPRRHSIKTFVSLDDAETIRDALLREVRRGGQAFFVHNRVRSIELITNQLRELLPEAKIEYGHGQMSESELEEVMERFTRHEFDILVSTTIIESGIDISNANTILIDRAHIFGLSQLYQMRGRVGRSDRQAYCYFLVPSFKNIPPAGRERLKAIGDIDSLGVGFHLAMRDLEIRGAGNILGRDQSGQVASVGYELYSKIIEEAVLHLKGESLGPLEELNPEVKLGVVAYIPDFYIPDVTERLILYQRLADLRSEQESQELFNEIIDRFGNPPSEVRNLMEVMRLRALLRESGITKLDRGANQGINLTLSPEAPLDLVKLLALTTRNKQIRLTRNLTLTIAKALPEAGEPDWKQLYNLIVDTIDLVRRNEGFQGSCVVS